MYHEIFDHLADKKVAPAVGTRTSRVSSHLGIERAKTLGAFNTDAQVADFLVGWAVRCRQDTVIDPSFGEGVFLHSACKRLAALGGEPSLQVYGVEVEATIHARIARRLSGEFGLGHSNLVLNDFFSIEPSTFRVDAVVGNPPFVRYQRFTGETRRLALLRAAAQGVSLTKLASSWAPFLIHCVSLLNKGGRLAMVAPFELCHAAYARPVLAFLARSFGSVTLATFRNKLFPQLSEDTLLILADDKGAAEHRLLWRDFGDVSELVGAGAWVGHLPDDVQTLDADRLLRGRERLVEYLLPERARGLYRDLRRHPDVRLLGLIADVGIGYVTGANDYFHLSEEDALRLDIPKSVLRPAVRRGRSLVGLRFTEADWSDGLRTGETGYLLHIRQDSDITPSVHEYLREGESKGVPQAYKCRTRSPWYRVPHVYHPDGFLTYMNGHTPRLVVNETQAVAPNSLHILRLHASVPITCDVLAMLWQTSLTRLSAEIEGHALGGGLLKVEPSEAESLLVPIPPGVRNVDLAAEMDALLREGRDQAVNDLADRAILQDGLGLTWAECMTLRQSGDSLRQRRNPTSYFLKLRHIYNERNPHAMIGVDQLLDDE